MFPEIINKICLPLRLILSHETLNKLGLWSLRDERYNIVMKNCQGRLLDIGCGDNQLVKKYGKGSLGIDVYDFRGKALIVKDSSNLPFADKSFQTVSFVASLQHIPNRNGAIKESYRVLGDKGLVLITILSPFIGFIRHKLAWWDEDQNERGMKEGEKHGLSNKEVHLLMECNGFDFVKKKRFVLKLNNLYIFKKR